jgi:hypothetical protein
MATAQKVVHERCPYCKKEVLGVFTLNDHFYSHYDCGTKAKRDKLVPEDFIVSLFVLV